MASLVTGGQEGAELDESVRLLVYGGYASAGQPPSVEAMAESLGRQPDAVQAALARLHEARHVVLDADGRIVMAHPFASIPLGFSAMGHDTLWWGGCAWDPFAIPQLVPDDPEVLVATQCPGCGRPLAWAVSRESPPDGDEVAHFLVPAARIWDDVVHTCDNQRLFCGVPCVERWLADTGNTRGYVMDVATLWRLASRWYEGRLEPGYVRREPARAREYFREVGLSGPFRGLD
jgi:hypothetical protein